MAKHNPEGKARIEFAPDGRNYFKIKEGRMGKIWDYFIGPDIVEMSLLNKQARFRLIGETGIIIGEYPHSKGGMPEAVPPGLRESFTEFGIRPGDTISFIIPYTNRRFVGILANDGRVRATSGEVVTPNWERIRPRDMPLKVVNPRQRRRLPKPLPVVPLAIIGGLAYWLSRRQ